MTVAEIKEYIDDRIKYYTDLELRKMGERGYYPFFKQKIVQELFNIKSMLDELEQEKNMYKELEDKIVRGESIPLMANEKFIEMLEKDTELEENNK